MRSHSLLQKALASEFLFATSGSEFRSIHGVASSSGELTFPLRPLTMSTRVEKAVSAFFQVFGMARPGIEPYPTASVTRA